MQGIINQGQTLAPVNMADGFLNQAQQLGELDLTTAVLDLMKRSQIPQANIDAYLSNPGIVASLNKNSMVQLWYQKDFWIYQLLCLQQHAQISTLEDRLLVNQFNDPHTWLKYFNDNVMDLVYQYDMPRRHGW